MAAGYAPGALRAGSGLFRAPLPLIRRGDMPRSEHGPMTGTSDRAGYVSDWAFRSETEPARGSKHVVLVAHDNKKADLLQWAQYNRDVLAEQVLYATGSTGRLMRDRLDLPIHRFLSGPLGGDQQIGAYIAQGAIDFLVFFWDPLEPQPHDPDVKALLRIATLWNIAVASNRTTADMVISSPLFSGDYARTTPTFDQTGVGRSR